MLINLDRLREAMREQSLSQAALARKAGLSAGAVQQVLNGSTKRSRYVAEIAKALDVDEGWLRGMSDNKVRISIVTDDRFDQSVSIPFMHSMHRPGENSELAASLITLSHNFFKKISGIDDAEKTWMLQVGLTVSQSMAPTLSMGDCLLILKEVEFDNSMTDIWMVVINEKVIICRVRVKGEGHYVISMDNPSSASIEVEKTEIRFVGKVIWQGRSLSLSSPSDD